MREAAKLISQQVEHALAHRNVSPFLRKTHSADYVSFGISALDSLTGGMPVGAITEMVGPECSGRTTAALCVVAAAMRSGTLCAWIDVADVLEPESAAANGVDMARLLWVRCGGPPKSHARHVGIDARSAPTSMHKPSATQPGYRGGGSPHPHSEGRDMPEAIGAMLKAHGGLYDRQVRRSKRLIGTPGAPNRQVSYRSESREEQVNSDRLPPRRGDNLAILSRCAEPQARHVPKLSSLRHQPVKRSDLLADSATLRPTVRWQALDQGLRAADLLLHNGGFSAIVLDLGSTPPEFVWRIPLATWFRFRAACDRTRASMILLTRHPCARSSAELVLRFQAGNIETHGTVMAGVRYQTTTERSRFAERASRVVSIRKPPQSERPGQWKSGVAWA